MIVNGLSIKQAIAACELQGLLPTTTLYSRVQTARKRGTYSGVQIKRPWQQEERMPTLNMIINMTADGGHQSPSTDLSPVTMSTFDSARSLLTHASAPQLTTRKRTRRSPKQASEYRLQAKRTKVEYDDRYKAAYKAATNTMVAKTGEPVGAMCERLNKAYNLDGKKRLARSTVYQANNDGLTGTSPRKKGPPPKIPHKLLQMVALHAEVCQVGNGELRGKDLRRLIGASKVGTVHADSYKVNSVWRKVTREFPESLQAATKIAVEDARAQWTTYDNLNQWFDDVKKDLLDTGLVEDEMVYDEKGEMLSELRFKTHSQRRIINMDETHHDLSITGDKGGSRAVSYHNPFYQRGAVRGAKSARHVTGVYATNAAGEALPPFYIYDSSAKLDENFRVKVSWLEGLPSVSGRYGCPTLVESDSFYAVRPRGSMDDTLLNQ